MAGQSSSVPASGRMDSLAFLDGKLQVRPLLSASRIFAAILENARMLPFVSLEGLTAKQHCPSKQVTNHQDCVGCVRYPRDHDRSTIAYTVEPIEVSHREVVSFRSP
jgi:hypothetical protein